jgi:hypothetical protein
MYKWCVPWLLISFHAKRNMEFRSWRRQTWWNTKALSTQDEGTKCDSICRSYLRVALCTSVCICVCLYMCVYCPQITSWSQKEMRVFRQCKVPRAEYSLLSNVKTFAPQRKKWTSLLRCLKLPDVCCLSLTNRKSSVHLHALYSPLTALRTFTPRRDQLVICEQYVTHIYNWSCYCHVLALYIGLWQMTVWMKNSERCLRKWSWPVLRCCPSTWKK